MKNQNKSIGEKIYLLRTGKNYDRATLADLLKVSERTIRRWERDKSKVRESNLLKLCLLFEVSIDYFKERNENIDK